MVKRCPLRVGETVAVSHMKEKMLGRSQHIPAGTGGFKVTEIHQTSEYSNGGYFIVIQSQKKINGGKVEITFNIMWPHFSGRVKPTQHYAGFRIFVPESPSAKKNNPYIAPSPRTNQQEIDSIIAKSVPAGSRKRLVLADFLEE